MTEPAQHKKSDLRVRVVSAVVMVAVAGTALWLGGWVWAAFVAMVALGVLWEWQQLAKAITESTLGRLVWFAAGFIYIGVAALMLNGQRISGIGPAAGFIACVAAVDIGAYFFGRAIGGPKIAPTISPSKTWAGLIGGITAAFAALVITLLLNAHLAGENDPLLWLKISIGELLIGAVLIGVTAQAGDFFESWIKRRAGVKDSGNLLPGHGGLFDRVDGLIAVAFAMALIELVIYL